MKRKRKRKPVLYPANNDRLIEYLLINPEFLMLWAELKYNKTKGIKPYNTKRGLP